MDLINRLREEAEADERALGEAAEGVQEGLAVAAGLERGLLEGEDGKEKEDLLSIALNEYINERRASRKRTQEQP